MSRTVMGSMWYLDGNALFLMTWNRDLFIDLEEKYIKKNIDFGDDERYSMTSIYIVTFQREYGSPLKLTYVKFDEVIW